jgi:hypothetical protein
MGCHQADVAEQAALRAARGRPTFPQRQFGSCDQARHGAICLGALAPTRPATIVSSAGDGLDALWQNPKKQRWAKRRLWWREHRGWLIAIWSLGGGTEQQQNAIDTALTVASSNTAIAEAELAKAFGYELCKCEFPPTPMVTVGYFNRQHANRKEGDPVYGAALTHGKNSGPPWTPARRIWIDKGAINTGA